MELVEDKHKSEFDIQKYTNRTIFISNKDYTKPIVIHKNSISLFSVANPSLITVDSLKMYFKDVDLILIGTGEKSMLLSERLISYMQDSNIGLEFMNTQSACKTHNLLLSESRSFSSILYP